MIFRIPVAFQPLAEAVRPANVLDRRPVHVQLLMPESHGSPFNLDIDPDTDPDPDPVRTDGR